MNIIDLKPLNQKNLFGYNDLFLSIINLYKNNKLPNKILFSGVKGIGKSTFAYHLINYIFSKDEQYNYDIKKFLINDSNKSFKLTQSKSHPNFHLIDIIDGNKVIEINQIREMISYSNKSAFNNKERIVLIDNVEKLNENSSNALLKIIEEPNENVFFILIFDNSKIISDTLKSRCIKFNFSLSSDQCIEITNKIIQNNLTNLLNLDLINYYNTVGDYINLINFSSTSEFNVAKLNLKGFLIKIIENKNYKKNPYLKDNIFKFIEFYLLKLINFNSYDKQVSLLYENFINKTFNLKKFNLDEDSFFIELKAKVLNE